MATPAMFDRKAPQIMRDLMSDLSLSVEDAAAILGNAGHESAGLATLQEIKPTVAGSRGGYGWFQWTGPRRRDFEAWAKAKGLSPASDEANYGFLLHELKTTEKAAIPALKAAVGLEAKVKAFEAKFERSGVKHYPSRLAYAKRALAAFTSSMADVPFIPPDIPVPVAKETAVSPLILGTLFKVVERVLERPSVPVENSKSGVVANAVVEAINESPNVAVVSVKSGWASKINWVQAGGIVASVAAFFGLDVPPDTLAAIIGGIQAAAALITVVMRTWFTRSVTTKSVGSP
jgi:hypothetical protein